MTKHYETVLFDADETLLDFPRCEKEAFCEAMRSFGVSVDEEMISAYSRINLSLWKALERKEIEKEVLKYRRYELFCEEYRLNLDVHAVSETYMYALAKKAYILEGADLLCRNLHGKVRMYIVTNGIGFIQRERQKRSGLSSYFEDKFISEDLGYEKPDVRFFEAVASSIEGFSKERTLIVGDSLTSDIRGGINFGIDTCWYNPKGLTAPSEIADRITYTVESFEEIEALILQGEK